MGNTKEDKYVGIFYWTWHDAHSKENGVRNVQALLDSLSEEEAKKAKNDYYHPVWEGVKRYHFWNEPVFGYYSTTDKYVLRKHAQMLADALIDVVFFDCTNGSYLWQDSYNAVFETFEEARKDGVKTPQVSFMLNFGPEDSTATMLEYLYQDIYKEGKYQDLWFYWDGKPLLMAHEGALTPGYSFHDDILDFFSFRNNDASYFTVYPEKNRWGWLSVYPQCEYNKDENGNIEQMTVGVAQNASKSQLTAMNGTDVLGRSYSSDKYSYTYTYGLKKIRVTSDIENSKLYGINFQEQWDYALKKDPKFIFVTGWNEWVAIRFDEWSGVPNGMADQFNDEYSRDVEPSKGDLQDHYYYQLVENVRRFKGISKPPKIKAKKTINIYGDIAMWDDIYSFDHYANNTYLRDHPGYIGTYYTNDTMRNDIISAKIAYDSKNIYFYVETKEDLSPSTDPAWMRLYFSTKDIKSKTLSWEGFEYVVNRISPEDNKAYLERSTGGYNWEEVSLVDYSIKGKVLQIKIPRKDIKDIGILSPLINFKWADNSQEDGNILDFYENGDVAPGGRFMFHFENYDRLYHKISLILAFSSLILTHSILFLKKGRKK